MIEWGRETVGWAWEALMLGKLVNAVLLCAQFGLLGALTVAVFTLLAQVFRPVTKERRQRD
jgi:hypothetical protein